MIFRSLIPNFLVNTLKHYPVGFLANLYYGFPSRQLKIIGVTGTDGKTTTCTMLYHVLKDAGFRVALISTVSAIIDDQELDTGFHVTSPDHFPLQKFLRLIADKNIEYVVLETTSHGFAQHRFWGIQFFAGIITNISKDHLDYHKTWEKYATAKSKLLNNVQYSILNIEDKSYQFLKSRASGKIITYGFHKGNINTHNNNIKLNILGDYNYYNGLAVFALASNLGIDKKSILKSLSNFQTVKGRMQVMHQKPLVIVDFAHTSNALKTALTFLNTQKSKDSRIISVFGCAGLRDPYRRKMGYESGKLADITIITAEDPRTEGVAKISDEIAFWAEKSGAQKISLFMKPACRGGREGTHSVNAGLRGDLEASKNVSSSSRLKADIGDLLKRSHLYLLISDRQQAIDFAISLARPQDIVGVFGKGHEQSMCFGSTETAWSDQEAVKKALESNRSRFASNYISSPYA